MSMIDNEPASGENADSEFASAFAEFSSDAGTVASDPPAPEDAPAEPTPPASEVKTAPSEQERPAPAPDPWANASPELLAERDRFLQADRSHRGRQAALQRDLDAARRAAGQPAATSQAAPEPQAESDALKRLREEYPDVAEPLLAEMQRIRGELNEVRGTTSTLAGDRATQQVVAELGRLETEHPDWRDFAADGQGNPVGSKAAALDQWLATQSPGVRQLNDSQDAGDIGTMLRLFKEAQPAAPNAPPAPTPDARRQKQLEGSRDAASKPAPAISGAPSTFDDAFAHYAAKADRELAQQRR